MNKYTVTIYIAGQGHEVGESVKTLEKAMSLARILRHDFGLTKNACDVSECGTGKVIARWRLLDGCWTAVVPS